MAESLVVIGRFMDPGQAHLMRTVLESYGIDAYVRGEITGSLEPAFSLFGGSSKGGIALLVRESDAAEAHAILDEPV